MAVQVPQSHTQLVAPTGVRPWAPRAAIAPQLSGSLETTLKAVSNGSRGCFGGWEISYPAGNRGDHFLFSVLVRWRDLQYGFESLCAEAYWRDAAGKRIDYAPLLDWERENGWVRLHKVVENKTGAAELVVKLLLRWSPTGEVEWKEPRLSPASPPAPRKLRLGAASTWRGVPPADFESNVRQVLDLCRRAADEGIHLLCLPETILTWRVPGVDRDNLMEHAIEIPGPYVEPFQALAAERSMALCLPVHERAGDLIYNSAVLIDEDGAIRAKYRKVHLAVPSENWLGVTPGDGFPVARIRRADALVGMNICMDSSAAESARAVARQGAEILLLPIMGDVRADRWSRGEGRATAGPDRGCVFDVERWMLIQRMRAMDNHLYVVAARNEGVGSGIFAPDGTILIMDGGDRPIVWADVDLADMRYCNDGARMRDECWFQRRESQYGILAGDLLPTM